MLEKLKAFFKNIFVSNPITFGAGLTPIVLAMSDIAASGIISEALFSWVGDVFWAKIVYYSVLFVLAALAVIFGGYESNKKADERKEAEKAVAAKKALDEEAIKIAKKKLALEKAKQEEAAKASDEARIKTLTEQAKREIAAAEAAKSIEKK